MFFKIGALKNFVNFTLELKSLFNIVAVTLLKKTLTQSFQVCHNGTKVKFFS